MPVLSRRLPAMIGYTLGALGLLLCTQQATSGSVWTFIACFSLATFGVEMTLSPSWAFLHGHRRVAQRRRLGGDEHGRQPRRGTERRRLSLFVANVTIPGIADTTGTANSFFVFAATMNVMAVVAWIFMNPLRPLKTITPARSDCVWCCSCC